MALSVALPAALLVREVFDQWSTSAAQAHASSVGSVYGIVNSGYTVHARPSSSDRRLQSLLSICCQRIDPNRLPIPEVDLRRAPTDPSALVAFFGNYRFLNCRFQRKVPADLSIGGFKSFPETFIAAD